MTNPIGYCRFNCFRIFILHLNNRPGYWLVMLIRDCPG